MELIDPEVEVKLNAPVVIVNPLLAVNVEADVIVPELVVAIVPEVERLPDELTVSCPDDPTVNADPAVVVPIPTLPAK